MQLGRGQGALSPSVPPPLQLPAPALPSPRGPGVPSLPLPAQECAQTALSSPSARLPVWCSVPRSWVPCALPQQQRDKTTLEVCAARPGLLRVGPARPGRCALPRSVPAVTSCRRARGSRGGCAGASLRSPRVAGPVCAALAAGLAAGSRGGGGLRAPSAPAPPAAAAPPSRASHAARAAGARRGCQARPLPAAPRRGDLGNVRSVLSQDCPEEATGTLCCPLLLR